MDDEQKKSGQTPGQPLPAFAPKAGRVFPKSPKQILIFERVHAFARLLRALDLFCQSVRSFLITGTAPRAYCSRRRITSVPCPFLRQSGSLACDRHHRSAILSPGASVVGITLVALMASPGRTLRWTRSVRSWATSSVAEWLMSSRKMRSARANQGLVRALDTTDCNAGRKGFLRVAVRDAGGEVGDVAPLTDPEPTGSDPDMAARTGVPASATSAVGSRSGELPDPGWVGSRISATGLMMGPKSLIDDECALTVRPWTEIKPQRSVPIAGIRLKRKS